MQSYRGQLIVYAQHMDVVTTQGAGKEVDQIEAGEPIVGIPELAVSTEC